MFWVDQDLGWRNLYSPLSTHNFVWDQQDEVSRWVLGVPAKHLPMDKTAFAEAKQRLASLTEQVSIKRKTIEALNREIGADSRSESRERLVKRRESLLAELERNNSALETLVKSTLSLDNKVDEAKRARDGIKFALNSAERRIVELRRLGEELKSEVSILETNEIAADAFRVFCGNETCQFFRRPEESYGRQLLYLKDQLKDFQSSFTTMEQDIGSLRSDLNESEKQLRDAIQERQLNVSKLPSAQIVPVIDAITRELSDINLRLEKIDSRLAEQKRFEAIIESTLKQEEEVKRLTPTGRGNTDRTRLNEIRETLTTCFKEWLRVLNTPNMPEKIWFDDDIKLNLGDERFSENSPFKGSTRTRIVLAYHASVVETSLKKDGNHPPFLILDTPKQHELHAADLAAFVIRFEEMVVERKKAFQLVIGATEEDFVAKTASSVFWRPRFGTADEPRFLGVPGTEFKPNTPVAEIQNQPKPEVTGE
jgi:prefoldin subunit 5